MNSYQIDPMVLAALREWSEADRKGDFMVKARQEQLLRELQETTRRRQSQGGGGMPSPAMAQQFMPGQESGGGGGFGNAVQGAASNPYAWIAAAIIGNEWNAGETGHRDSNGWKHLQDVISADVMYQDIDRFGIGGQHKLEAEFGAKMGNPLGRHGLVGDPSGTWDSFKNTAPIKLLRKLF